LTRGSDNISIVSQLSFVHIWVSLGGRGPRHRGHTLLQGGSKVGRSLCHLRSQGGKAQCVARPRRMDDAAKDDELGRTTIERHPAAVATASS